MKNLLSVFFIFTAFFSSAAAQTAKPDAVGQNLRNHIKYLASDALEGRRTGERGAISAAGYIANMFAGFGLKGGVLTVHSGAKISKTNGFLQTFGFVTSVKTTDANSFSFNAPNTANFALKNDWSPLGFSPNADIKNVPTVFVGYGIESDEAHLNDYEGVDADGKIAVAFDGTPDKDSPHSSLARFDARAKANIAKQKGAVALILISSEDDLKNDRFTTLRYDQTLGESALPSAVVSRSLGAKILGESDVAQLRNLEKGLATRKDAPNAVSVKLSPQTSVNASLKIDLARKNSDAYNVTGVIEGTDLKDEAIIIGAHYDHLGHGGAGSLAVNSNEIHHGADDNSSGVSALLELARRFAKTKPRRTLIFIAFGGEEEGLLGSKAYVSNPVFPLEKTIAMFNMDMIGRLKDDKLTVGGIGTASEWRGLVERKNGEISAHPAALQAEKLPSTANIEGLKGTAVSMTANVPAFALQLNEDGFGPSDHSSFYGKQIPVLFFFTGTHEDYHKPSDTAEKINYAGVKMITEFVESLVKTVDANAKRPTYAVAKSSGMGRAGGFRVYLGTVPSYAESNDGLVLDAVRDDSPAAKAGLKAGDKIVKLAGKDVRNVSDYTFVLGEMKAETAYDVEIMRGAERLTLKITPQTRR